MLRCETYISGRVTPRKHGHPTQHKKKEEKRENTINVKKDTTNISEKQNLDGLINERHIIHVV